MSNFNLSHDEYKYLQKTIFGVDLDAKSSRGRGQSQMEDESSSSAELIVNQYKQPEEQGFFADVVDSVQMGAWQGVGDLARGMGALFNSDWLNQAADVAARNAEANRETMSTKMQEALGQNAFDGWDSETGEGKGVANIYWWAGNLGALIGQNIDTVVTMGAGKLATTGIKAGGKLAGKYFSKEVAEQVGKAAVKQASRFGIPAKYHKMIGYTAVSSAMAAGSRANQVRDELSNFSNEDLAQQHGFQTAYWDLKDSEEGQSLSDNEIFERARQQYYNEVGRDVMLDPAAIAADVTANAIGGLGGGILGMPNVNKLLGKPAKRITSGFLKGALVEAGTEGIQGAAEQYAINDTAKEYYDSDRTLTHNMGENIANSMALGAGFGGVMGGYEAGSHNRAMNRQKKRLLEAVSTGDERVDAQIRAQVEAYNRMANDLDELVSPERLRALNQAGLQAVEKNKRRTQIETELRGGPQTETANTPYHQRNLAELQEEFIQNGFDENDFNDFVEANLQQATADLQNLQANPFRMGADFQKGLAEKQAYNAKLADAQARVNFFTQAKNAPKSGAEPSQVEGQSELQINPDDIKLSRSAMKSVEANIARGREAMTKAILDKSSVHRAMYNHELGGWVDFEWGDDGLTKPFNKKGEPIGKGIAHIIETRMRKDGMSYENVTKMLTQDIVNVIAQGQIAGHWVRNDGKSESVQIDYNGYRAGLIRNKGSNTWLLTAFELYPTDVNSAGSVDTEKTTHIKPTLTRPNMGAVGTENLPSFADDVKFSRSAPQETQSFNVNNDDIRFSFAGMNAQNADNAALVKAMDMAENGANPEDVRKQTGWFQGVDGKWRFEIDDSQVQVKNAQGKTIGEVLGAPLLFKAYPDLAQIAVQKLHDEYSKGEYNRLDNVIGVNNKLTEDELKSVLLHELQHAIQMRENFARGGSNATKNHLIQMKERELEQLRDDAISLRKLDKEARYLQWQADGIKLAQLNKQGRIDVENSELFYNFLANSPQAKEIEAIYEHLLTETDNQKQQQIIHSLIPAWLENDIPKGYAPLVYANELAQLAREKQQVLALPENKAILREFDRLEGELNNLQNTSADFVYNRLAGEVEARNVQARLDMNKQERINRSPFKTQGLNKDNQLVYFGDEVNYSLNEDPNSSFAKAVDAVVAGKVPAGYINMGTTPDVLKMLGVGEGEVRISGGTIEKAMLNHLERHNNYDNNRHSMSPNALKRLPQQLNNPIAVFNSSTRENSFVVLTELIEFENGRNKPVIAALHFSKTKRGADLIDIASVYGRSDGQLANAFNKDLLYFNKAKGQQFLKTHPLQLHWDLTSDANLSALDIKTERDLSQYQGKQKTQAFDFTHEKSQIATAVGKGLSRHFEVTHSSELGIDDPTIEAAYNTKTGKIVIIADNIRANSVLSREERLKWVAWHELAHRGLQVRYGKDFQALMEKVDQNTTIRDLATALQKDRAELKDNRILAIEEAIAELHAAYTTGKMEELKNRYGLVVPRGREISLKSWFRITAERIREFMAKIFGIETANRFSHDDLLNLLKDIQQSAGGDVNGVESDVRHSFAGENAKTANHSLLAQAKSAVANGANPEDVRKQTGWFQGVDGKWRFEIDDSSIGFTPAFRNPDLSYDEKDKLGQLITHDTLFEAYPELKTLRAIIISSERARNPEGYYDPIRRKIFVEARNDIEAKSILAHEIQHAIQHIEGFSAGGNDAIAYHQILNERGKEAREISPQDVFDRYLSFTGEVEARNVQARLMFNEQDRLNTPPESTEDISRDKQHISDKWETSYSLNEDPNSSFAKAEINPERQAYTFSEAREQAKAFQGKELVNKQSDVRAMVSRNSLDKMLSAKAVNKSISPAIHSLAVANADKLYENALYGWSKPDRDNDSNISAIHRLFAILNSGEGKQLVKLTVKETAQVNRPNRLYTIEAVELNENTPAAQWVGEMLQQDNVEPRTIRSARDIFNLAQSVEKSNSSTDFRFSRSQSNVERLRGLNQPTKLDNMKDVAKAMANRPLSEWKSLMVEYGKQANTKIFDALAPIKYAEDKAGITDHSQSAYTAARLAAGSASIAEASMLYGLPEYREGIIQRKNGTTEKDALFGILQALGNEANDFLAWVAGNRADKLMQEGRENHFSQAEIDELKALNRGREQRFEQARQKLMAWNQSLLDLAEHSGLINQEDRAKWEDKEFYIPFYREDDDGDAIAPYRNKGLSGQNAGIKRLKGSDKAINDLLENVITNATKLIDASVKNAAMTKAVTNLADTGVISLIENPTYADWKKLGNNKHGADKDGGVAMVRIEGKEQMVRINDAMLFNAITSIDQQPLDYPFRKLFAGPKRVLTATVTSMPNFIVRNFLRDMAQAWVVDKNNGFKLGMDSIKGLKDAYKRSGSSIDLMFAGASFGAGYVNGGNPEQAATQIRRHLRKQGKSAAEIDGFMDGVIFTKDKLGSVLDKYFHLSHAAENANRIAVYDRAIASGKSKAQAALESKDLMDFSMHGSAKALRVLGDVLPFFNARLQGMSQLGRAFKDNPRELAKRGAMIALASVALAAMNQGEEWYEEQSDEIKDNFWLANIGGQIIKIPKPFELGVVFGTIPERLFRTMSGADDTGRFKDRLLSAISNTLSLNPIPQAVKPIFEVYNNYDSFRGREIETLSDRRLLKEARFDDRTSLFSRGIAGVTSVFGLSPKQTDHLIHGYFGTLGMYVLGMSDVAIRQAGDYGELPAKNWSEYPVLDAVFGGDVAVPRKYTRYMNDYYHFLNQVSEISATVNSYKADGRKAEAKLLLAENQRLLAYKPVISQTQKELKAIKAKMDAIQNNGNLSAAEKRQRLDRLRENKNAIVRMVVERMEREDF